MRHGAATNVVLGAGQRHCAIGTLTVNKAIAWMRAPLRRLPAPPRPRWDRGRRRSRFSVSTVLLRPPRVARYAFVAALRARPTYRVAAARSPFGSSPARPGRRQTRRARAEDSH